MFLLIKFRLILDLLLIRLKHIVPLVPHVQYQVHCKQYTEHHECNHHHQSNQQRQDSLGHSHQQPGDLLKEQCMENVKDRYIWC